MDHDFRPFSVRDVERAIREASESTAVGPDGLTVAHLKHLGVSGLAFLTELFNLSLGGIDLSSIYLEMLHNSTYFETGLASD